MIAAKGSSFSGMWHDAQVSEEIIGGVTAIVSYRAGGWIQQSAVPRCANLFVRKHGRYWAVKRRDFITLLGAAATCPIAAWAQTTEKIYRLGALSPATAQLDSIRSIVLPELAKAGIAEGRNLILDARAGSMEQLPGLARDLIASNPDAVMAVSGAAIGRSRRRRKRCRS
jgi:hypothetical protein